MTDVAKYLLLFSVLISEVVRADVVPVYQVDQAQINQGQQAYLQTLLTHDIYRYSNSPNLEDLVIIDAQGIKLPYQVSPLEPRPPTQLETFPARFFPVAVGAPPETLLALSSASIRLDDNEISVSVEKKASEQLQDKSIAVDFYVVDLADVKNGVDALKIDWRADSSAEFVEVQVNGSNDLTNWTMLRKTTLVQLRKADDSLVRNHIPLQLEASQYAYLQIKFPRTQHIEVLSIDIQNTEATSDTSVVDRWKINGKLVNNHESVMSSRDEDSATVAAWEYERDDIASVETLNLELGHLVYGDNFRIFSRADERAPWRLVHQGIWFNVQVGDRWEHSSDIRVSPNTNRFWRVELNEAVRASANPSLVFIRQPERIRFIASNFAPFSVAVETDHQHHNSQAHGHIFSQLTAGKQVGWVDVSLLELKPDIAQFARNGLHISWKSILFWGILTMAVFCLLLIAMKLLKQMARENGLDPTVTRNE